MSFKKFASGFKKGQGFFTESLSTIVNTVILTLIYIIGVGATSIFVRGKKRMLHLETEKGKKSYWENIEKKDNTKEGFYKQF